MQRENHIINAEGKILGRLATEIADLLRGKNKPDFVRNQDMGDFVTVENMNKIKVSGRKMEQKKYYHHTGYLGGLKEISLGKLFSKKPNEILKRAVSGMLPKNKLRDKQIKRLKFQ